MEKPLKFVLPSPNFNKNGQAQCKPKLHYLTPSGMSLLPREKQTSTMCGKHLATLPYKYVKTPIPVGQQSALKVTPNQTEKQYCEPCELELNSLEDLKQHRAQHEECPVVGCLYKGHPSVMDKHVNALHASGLFDKFKKLSTPEEIAAWREERRKKYPTLANVILKQKAKEQRQKRGERLETQNNRFGKVNDRRRAQPNTAKVRDQTDELSQRVDNKTDKNKRNCRNRNKRSKGQGLKTKLHTDIKQKNEELDVASDFSCSGIPMFKGTSQLNDYKHFNDKDVVTNNILFGLVGMYGSSDDDESEDNGDEEQKVQQYITDNSDTVINVLESNTEIYETNPEVDSNAMCNITTTVENTTDIFIQSASPTDISLREQMADCAFVEAAESGTSNLKTNSSDEAPEEIPIQRNTPDCTTKPKNSSQIPEAKRRKLNEQPPTATSSKPKQLRKYGLDYRKARLRKQNTMLEKLLESDIRHERNVLLQCIRYVCENNFFNIGQNKAQETLVKNKR